MHSKLLDLVERVIRKSTKEHPADAVLRETLKAQVGLRPEHGTEVSRAVFSYYRWLGWLDQKQEFSAQIDRALDLTSRFSARPESFSATELMDRAVPGWIKNEMTVTSDWVRAIQAEPKLWLRARPGQGGTLAGILEGCRTFGRGHLSDTLSYRGLMDLFRTPNFHAGDFEVQDISSQAVGFICDPKPGETWFDACAGEGGKLLHLSDLMNNQGLIWAADRAPWRLQKLKRRAARAKVFNYRAVLWEGGARLPTKTKFDGVLVDAPCAGIGTWQRNPHARWMTTPEDVHELAQVQSRLLSNVAAAVKPGGKLVYSVCTLSNAETTGVTDAFEQRFPDFTRIAIRNPLKQESLEEQAINFQPQEFGGNGMFVAAWRRNKTVASISLATEPKP